MLAGIYVLAAPGHMFLLDATYKLDWAKNFVNYGQLYFDRNQVESKTHIGTYFKYGRDGHLYIHFPLGGLFCFIPAALLDRVLTALWPALTYCYIGYYSATFTNVPFAAGTAVLAFWLARHLGYSRRRSAGAAATVGIATPVLPYATYDFNEPVAAFFALLAVYLLITSWGERRVGKALAAGAALGLGFTIRYELAAVAAALCLLWLIFAFRRKLAWRPLLFFIMGLAPVAALVPLYNWWARGSAGDFAYNTLPFFWNLIVVRFVPIMGGGPHMFILRYIWIYFLSPNLHNVILYCPLFFLGAICARALVRAFGPRILLLVIPGIALTVTILALTYSTWAWGLRYAYMFWALLAVAGVLVPRRRRWFRVLYGICVGWGIFLSFIAVAQDYQITQNDLAAEILGDPSQVNYRGWLPRGRMEPAYSQILWQAKYAGLAFARTFDYYVHGGIIRWFDPPKTAGNDVERGMLDIWPVYAEVSGGVAGTTIWPLYILVAIGTAGAATWLRRLVRREDFDFYWRGDNQGV